MSKIIKQSGTDWIITIRVPDDDDYPVSIFGVATEDEAIEEGLASFGVTRGEPKNYKIISVEKLGE